MNVIGSRPDAWWRDRPAAAARLVAQLGRLAAATGDEVSVVFDGEPVELPAGPPVEVSFAGGAPGAADDAITARVARSDAPGTLEVVTSDRALAERVASHGAHVSGAGAFRRRLDEVADAPER